MSYRLQSYKMSSAGVYTDNISFNTFYGFGLSGVLK